MPSLQSSALAGLEAANHALSLATSCSDLLEPDERKMLSEARDRVVGLLQRLTLRHLT